MSSNSNCCSPVEAELDPVSQAIKDFYNAAADGDGSYSEGTDKFSPSGPTEEIIRLVLNSDKEKILDIGCGMGTTLMSIAESHTLGKQFIGVDFSERMIARARDKSKDLQENIRKNSAFFVADVQEMPYMDEQFDFIYSECVFNLVQNRTKAMQEVHRLLAPGGIFVYTDFVSFADVPGEIKNDLSLVSGCRAGSIRLSENLSLLEEQGFRDFDIINFTEDKNKRYRELMDSSEEYRREHAHFKENHPLAHEFLETKVGYYLIKAVKH